MARRVRRGVKARRVVRRFELWSVAKLALVFHLFCFALTVAVLVVLWNVAFKLGTITKLETFLSDFGFSDKASRQDFRLHGDAIFRAGTMAGLGLVALNTLATVLLAFFYNGVSGLFGGVVVSVLEERVPPSPAERRALADAAAAVAGDTPVLGELTDGKRLGRRVRRKRERAARAAVKTAPQPEATTAITTESPSPAAAASSKASLKAKAKNGTPRPKAKRVSKPAGGDSVSPIAQRWADDSDPVEQAGSAAVPGVETAGASTGASTHP